MPAGVWRAKDERMYEHVKSTCRSSGKKLSTCTRIAAATVNKYRAEMGLTKTVGCHCPRGTRPLKSDKTHCYNPKTRKRPSRVCLPGARRK
jgi:hypothetical protein